MHTGEGKGAGTFEFMRSLIATVCKVNSFAGIATDLTFPNINFEPVLPSTEPGTDLLNAFGASEVSWASLPQVPPALSDAKDPEAIIPKREVHRPLKEETVVASSTGSHSQEPVSVTLGGSTVSPPPPRKCLHRCLDHSHRVVFIYFVHRVLLNETFVFWMYVDFFCGRFLEFCIVCC